MSDYDLTGLSPTSFEHLIQALGVRVLGPGLSVFGSGPDGGREATFTGKMTFPGVEHWDGYCVLQAKFLQRPHDTRRDGQWLIAQIKKELEEYVKPGTLRKSPEYYIICSNVVLSPGAASGGKDQLAKLIESYRGRLQFKGWASWDYDQIRTFLDAYPEVARKFAGWITTGDVLHAIIEHIKGISPDFESTLQIFLAKEFLSDQYSNLEQAGHSIEERIPLARVFVDLPTSRGRLAEPPAERFSRNASNNFLRKVLDAAREQFDCSAPVRERQRPDVDRAGLPDRGRIVLIGGPGQGKTTLGQFVCQVFRGSLLQSSRGISPEAARALALLLQQCEANSIQLPTARRFPVRVVLNSFAAWLDGEGQRHGASLLAYIAQLISKRTGRQVAPDDLRRWLREYPWILVLDGLDEVPASSNRQAVVKSVEEFWVDAAYEKADLLVIATTRPQGFGNEFSPELYSHLYLAPLSRERARQYAERLIAARHPEDEQRRERIQSRLELASRLEQTAKLMRSPLQVTIMATLVDQVGNPPQERWRLFHEYYQVIYRREMERDLEAATLLREYRKDIDTIHTHVALALQVASERGGGTDPKLSADAFGRIVDNRLQAEGHNEADRARLKASIIDAASQRLVFLVGVEAGAVGFEIRSLQEFMAAEAVMAGSEHSVRERLRCIAPVESWRNVFLFAAGRCFADAQHLRDAVYAICVDMNLDPSSMGRMRIKAGSSVALALLEDGVTSTQPRHARLLAECALAALDAPLAEVHSRLAFVYEERLSDVYQERIRATLDRRHPADLSAWRVLADLAEREVAWARALADRWWDDNREAQLDALVSAPKAAIGEWLLKRANDVVRLHEPWRALAVTRETPAGHFRRERHGWLGLAAGTREVNELRLGIAFGGEARCTARLSGLRPLTVPLPEGEYHNAWEPIVQGERLAREPGPSNLSQALRRIAENCPTWTWSALRVPWVLGASLAWAESRQDLVRLADAAAAGAMGNGANWLDAERRWREAALTSDDVLYAAPDNLPFDASVGTRGCPMSALSDWLFWATPRTQSPMQRIHDMAWAASDPRVRRKLLAWVLSLLRLPCEDQNVNTWLTPEILRSVIATAKPRILYGDMFLYLLKDGKLTAPWLDVLDERPPDALWHFNVPAEVDAAFMRLAANNIDRPGILRLVGLLAEDTAGDLGAINSEPSRWHGDARTDALMITAAPGNIREPELIGGWMAEACKKDAGVVSRLSQALTEQGTCDPSTERFLVSVIDALPEDAWELRRRVLDAIGDVLERVATNMDDPKVWSSLGFADAIRDASGAG